MADRDPKTGHFAPGNRVAEGKTLYTSDTAEQAYKLCLLGATDAELADFFDINVLTIHRWKVDHPEFGDALRRGKEVADANVAEKLYHRAMGYSHPAVKIFMPQGASAPVYADYTEHYPPDTQAASMWLRNRQPKKWRDKLAITGGEEGDAPLVVKVVKFAGDNTSK